MTTVSDLVLGVLRREPECQPARIAAMTGKTPSHIGVVLTKLRDRGLVERVGWGRWRAVGDTKAGTKRAPGSVAIVNMLAKRDEMIAELAARVAALETALQPGLMIPLPSPQPQQRGFMRRLFNGHG